MLGRLRLTLHGTVQGVALRWGVQQRAQATGLVGTVQNQPNGTVVIVAEGETAALERLLAWIERPGHGWRITRLDPAWSAATGSFTDFRIKW